MYNYKNKVNAALIFLLLFAGVAHADQFECQIGSRWSNIRGVELTAIVKVTEGVPYAAIYVAGTHHIAHYTVEGFNRHWAFGSSEDENNLRYSFVIHPDNKAFYYDLSVTELGEDVNPTQIYICRQISDDQRIPR